MRSVRLRLVRAANVTLSTDPSLVDLHRVRFEGTPPKVRDLVGGSDIALEDRGTHTLKGLPDPWQLFAAG